MEAGQRSKKSSPAGPKSLDRVLHTLLLVTSGPGWTIKRLAHEMKVDERTVGRYVKTLKNAGYPVMSAGDNSGYYFDKSQFVAPFQLKVEEVAALSLLADQLTDKVPMPGLEQARAALLKIRGTLPAQIQQELMQVSRGRAVRLASGNSAAETLDEAASILETVNDAIRTGRKLQCKYESMRVLTGNGKADPFLLAPYVLLFETRSWYVVGRHEGHKEVRTLRLSRFTDCRLTDKTFTVPAAFSLQKHIGNAWRMVRGGREYDVVLRFDKQFADGIESTRWHPTQTVEQAEDGSIRVRFRVDGLEEIVWWVLEKGSHCVVEEPAELVELVKKELRGSLKGYGG